MIIRGIENQKSPHPRTSSHEGFMEFQERRDLAIRIFRENPHVRCTNLSEIKKVLIREQALMRTFFDFRARTLLSFKLLMGLEPTTY